MTRQGFAVVISFGLLALVAGLKVFGAEGAVAKADAGSTFARPRSSDGERAKGVGLESRRDDEFGLLRIEGRPEPSEIPEKRVDRRSTGFRRGWKAHHPGRSRLLQASPA